MWWFFSSRRRHTRYWRDGVQTCALPIYRRRRADEGQPLRGADLGEVRVLGQEAVAGVDRVGAGPQGRLHDVGHVQVAAPRRGRPDVHGLVRQVDDGGVPVGGRVDGDDLDAELAAGTGHPHGDLAAVGDEHAADHRARPVGRSRMSTWSYSTDSASPTRTSATTPASSARIGFISFIASTIPTVCPGSTSSPTRTNGSAPGDGAA